VVARAIEQEPGDAEEFLTRVSQQAAHGLFGALEDRQPNLSRTVVEEAAKTAVGFVPFVGPFVGGVVSVGEVAAEKLHGSRSGIAAIMPAAAHVDEPFERHARPSSVNAMSANVAGQGSTRYHPQLMATPESPATAALHDTGHHEPSRPSEKQNC
jgi:hypothetical protein